MITNIQHNRFQYISKLLALPLLVLVVAAFAIKKVNNPSPRALKEPTTVVIDAGHGGSDPGAMGADTSISEALLSLQIAKRIQELSSEYGVKVVMTREGNEFPGNLTNKDEANRRRVEIATEAKARLFVSIHASAAPEQPTRTGFHAFTTAKRTDERSNTLASILLQELGSLYKTDLVIKQRNGEGIYVLDKAPCPAVLIECGYISNPVDVDYIKTSANQEKIARRILGGIVKYNLHKFTESTILIDQPSSYPSEAVTPVVAKPITTVRLITDTLDIAELKQLNPDDILKIDMGKTAFTVTLKNGEKKLFRTADLNESITLSNKKKATVITKEKNTSVAYSDPVELDKINPNDIASMHIDKKEKKTMTIHLKNGQVMVMDADKVSSYYEHKKGNKVSITANALSEGETITVTNLKANKDTAVTDIMITETEQDPEKKQLIFTSVETEAEYPGGTNAWARYLMRTLRYPAEAVEKNIQGKVVVQFIVDKDGSISDVKAIEGPVVLRIESERIVREGGGWIPAIQNGRKVRAYKKQPIKFMLTSNKN